MANIQISVIIPSFRAENYIGVALEALYGQTLSQEAFEVIVVDDHSDDRTVEIVRTYSTKIENLKVISLPKNSGGPVIPRNKGIDVAEGKYIFFHDSDDYLTEDALETFSRYANKTDADIIIPKMKGENGRSVPQSQFKNGSVENAEFVRDSMTWNLNPIKLFKTSLIKKNNIRFREEAPVFEDHVFVIAAMLHSSKISILDGEGFYVATYREGDHLSVSNWTKPAEQVYKAVEIILQMIHDKFYLSGVQRARWSTAILRRHLKQIQEKSDKYSTDRLEPLIRQLKKVIGEYAEPGWITLLPKAYHNTFGLLQTLETATATKALKERKTWVNTTDDLSVKHSSDYRKVNYFSSSLFFIAEKKMFIPDEKGDVKVVEKNDVVPTQGLEWDMYGWPHLLTTFGKINLFESAIDVPSKDIRELFGGLVRKLDRMVIINTDVKLLEHIEYKKIAKFAGIPLNPMRFSLENKMLIIKTELGDVIWDPATVLFVRSDIENYLTSGVDKVKVNSEIPFYNDTKFVKETQTGEFLKKGQKVDVSAVVYTQGGTPRLKTERGYITANQKFVSGYRNKSVEIIIGK